MLHKQFLYSKKIFKPLFFSSSFYDELNDMTAFCFYNALLKTCVHLTYQITFVVKFDILIVNIVKNKEICESNLELFREP